MSEARRISIGFVALVVVMGIVMFLVPSAYAASRGAPVWLAAVLGALAFPALPLTWHIIGERRRRAKLAVAKAPAKGVLTRGDRFVFRCLGVALVAVVPVFALGGKGALSGVWHNVGWFIPTTPPEPAAPVLGRVPVDAEIVFTFHADEDKKKSSDDTDDTKPKKRSGPVDGVLAYGGGQLMAAVVGPLDDDGPIGKKIDELNAQRDKIPLKLDKVSEVKSSSDEIVIASDGWRAKVDPPLLGPNADIRRELGRAPANANAVLAVVPRTTRELMVIKSGAAWVVVSEDTLRVEGRVEAVDAASAGKALDYLRAQWKEQASKIPDSCKDAIDKAIDHVHLDQNGALITLKAELPMTSMAEVVMCGMGAAMKN